MPNSSTSEQSQSVPCSRLFDVVSLFAPMFAALTNQGVTRRAFERGLCDLQIWNPRDFTHDAHRTVDDRPYGGGPGMVMLVEPLRAAIQAARQRQKEKGLASRVLYLSPQGVRLTQQKVRELVAQTEHSGLILLCGRYEAIDERLLATEVDEEISVGDYVVSGGELPAMLLLDALIRLLPGVLNDPDSAKQDSFAETEIAARGVTGTTVSGLLDCPHYTRPDVLDDMAVPAVLMSGNHALIAQWRREQALLNTLRKRPDVLEQVRAAGLLTARDENFLASINID